MARLPAMPSAIRNSEQWERLPRLGAGPQAHAEATAILAAIRRVIDRPDRLRAARVS
jgi:hypothetical protein